MKPTIHLDSTVEEPVWFGPPDRRLAGWLTRPTNSLARGGVLLSPPIGREARAGRRALRYLAVSLAERGFVSLRFDYDGTGDSCGNFDDANRDRAWVDGVVQATRLLRSMGLASISAVGMRLGATITAVAASANDLRLSSVVLWDPCESGRSYLRELSALEALRREGFEVDPNGSVETTEFVFSPRAANELRRLSLTEASSGSLGQRVLVVVRDDRVISEKLRVRLDVEQVEWETTSEQSAMLDVEPLDAVLAFQTMSRMMDWLAAPAATLAPFDILMPTDASVVVENAGEGAAVTERFVRLGPRQLFGVVSEPVGETRGPWIVLLNAANEDHTGRSRLWVELSRRWASHGLRCVRFDLTGLGDSPWTPDQADRPFYPEEWLEDVPDVVRVLSPEDPSNAVFIGLCSGAYLSVEGALALKARGVCALNPPVGCDYLHGVARLGKSRWKPIRALAVRLKQLGLRHCWAAAGLWELLRIPLPSSFCLDIMAQVVDDGTDLLVLASTDDLSPYPSVPFLRSLDSRRVASPRNYEVQFVPGLDHGMQNADGKARVVEILDRHILEHFGGISPESGLSTGPIPKDRS